MATRDGLELTSSVTGVREALRELKKVDDALYWTAIKKMKDAADPIVAAIDGGFPSPPPRGFAHNGRTGWGAKKPTVVQYGGRASRGMKSRQVWPLIRVKIVDAPRQIFDMAGARDSSSQNRLNTNLSKSYGPASRAVYRVSERTRRLANEAVVDAMREVVRYTNRKLSVIRSAA